AETGYQIGNKYNINKSTVYIIKKEMKENKPLLSSTSTTQEQIFLENIEINEQYKKGSTIQELAEKYNVEEWLLNVVLESMIYVEETIENIVKTISEVVSLSVTIKKTFYKLITKILIIIIFLCFFLNLFIK